MSNSLAPDQARFVGPDLGPNCLQRLSTDKKVITSRERVNATLILKHIHCIMLKYTDIY